MAVINPSMQDQLKALRGQVGTTKVVTEHTITLKHRQAKADVAKKYQKQANSK